MSFINDLFGNQPIGNVLRNAVAGALSGGRSTTNTGASNDTSGGFSFPVKASVDEKTIRGIFGWVTFIVVLIVGSVLLTRKRKRRY